MTTTHVIGAGLSGLACALRLALADRQIVLYEAAGHAGGRARSFVDEGLGCLIDNGSHMLMGANDATRTFLSDIGSENALDEIAPATFPFLDLSNGQRWQLRPNMGPFPFWILMPGRRIPGTRAADYLAVTRLARAKPRDTVADCLDTTSPLWEKLWQPLVRAVLNTDATEGSARLMWTMIAATLMKGEAASRPLHFGKGLSPTLIDPALAALIRMGVDVRFKARLRGLGRNDHRIDSLHFGEGVFRIGRDDIVVLAVPADACAELWPDANPPSESRAIVNAHFKIDQPIPFPTKVPFLGLVGTEAQWIFRRDNIMSATISAADRHAEKPAWQLANMLWSEIARALGRNVGRVPPWRVIKEKRATFAQTPAQVARRPGPKTTMRNLLLAGDWTATGLPATIEGSIRSGFTAAQCALSYEAALAESAEA